MCANFTKKKSLRLLDNFMKAYELLQKTLTILQMYETTSLMWVDKKVAYLSNLKTNRIGT